MEEYNEKQFKPGFDVCYRPDLFLKNKCSECDFKGYAHCKMHPEFEEIKKEWEKKHKK